MRKSFLFSGNYNLHMAKSKKPVVVGIEILKKNGLDVDSLIKELVINASVEFTAYYYFT